MFDGLGYKVISLKRLAQGPLVLGDLKPGKWRALSPKEIQMLKN